MVGCPVASVVRREGRRLMGASGKSGLDWRPKGGWWFGNRVIAVVEGCKVGEKETAGLGPAPLDGQERQRQNASNARSGVHQSSAPRTVLMFWPGPDPRPWVLLAGYLDLGSPGWWVSLGCLMVQRVLRQATTVAGHHPRSCTLTTARIQHSTRIGRLCFADEQRGTSISAQPHPTSHCTC